MIGRRRIGPWITGIVMLGAGAFVFLNRRESLGWPPRWQSPQLPRLWEYNLHYFEWLWALDFPEGRAAAERWIAEHGLARGRVGWEPYPVCLRLMNWCGFFFGRHADRIASDVAFREELWRSIHLQAAWLAGHLETYQRDAGMAKTLINIGESKPDPKLAPAELAAFTALANTLLNLDETINKP